jgi:hypothetical protein
MIMFVAGVGTTTPEVPVISHFTAAINSPPNRMSTWLKAAACADVASALHHPRWFTGVGVPTPATTADSSTYFQTRLF